MLNLNRRGLFIAGWVIGAVSILLLMILSLSLVRTSATAATSAGATSIPAPTGVPAPTQAPVQHTFTQVSAGERHTCGLQVDGTVVCWGDNTDKQTNVLTDTFIQIAAGPTGTCGVKSDGKLACWGTYPEIPADLTDETFTQISFGKSHICAVKSDTTWVCWPGDNNTPMRRLGDGYMQISASPLGDSICGVLFDDERTSNNLTCQGIGSIPDGNFTQVSVGATHACALTATSTLACWGDPTDGKTYVLSDNDTDHLIQVVAGDRYTCALASDGKVVCWGALAARTPTGAFSRLSSGTSHVCGIKSDGTVVCWGDNSYGQATPPK